MQGIKGMLDYDVDIRIKLSKELKEKARNKARANKTDLSKLVREFLEQYINENK